MHGVFAENNKEMSRGVLCMHCCSTTQILQMSAGSNATFFHDGMYKPLVVVGSVGVIYVSLIFFLLEKEKPLY